MSKKIAIVGAGLSGLAAAWMLHESGFEVAVFESSDRIGGMVKTIEISANGRPIRFDPYMGNPAFSHNMLALCERLEIPVTTGVFGLYYEHPEKSWNTDAPTEFRLAHQEECERFSDLMRDFYERNSTIEAGALSLADFLRINRFSEDFSTHILYPFLHPMMDILLEDFDRFPVAALVELFGLNISNLTRSTPLFHFNNGMYDFLEALGKPLQEKIRLNCRVARIVRAESGVEIVDAKGNAEHFDEVVLSGVFLQNLELIADLTPAERTMFNSAEYRKATLTIHGDTGILPKNYFSHQNLGCISDQDSIHGPIFEHGQPRAPMPNLFWNSVNGNCSPPAIDPDKIFYQRVFWEETLTKDSMELKGYIRHIQGNKHTWYCGFSTVIGLAECCVASGFAVAEQLGAQYPFAGNQAASRVLENVNRLMFGGFPSLRMFS